MTPKVVRSANNSRAKGIATGSDRTLLIAPGLTSRNKKLRTGFLALLRVNSLQYGLKPVRRGSMLHSKLSEARIDTRSMVFASENGVAFQKHWPPTY